MFPTTTCYKTQISILQSHKIEAKKAAAVFDVISDEFALFSIRLKALSHTLHIFLNWHAEMLSKPKIE